MEITTPAPTTSRPPEALTAELDAVEQCMRRVVETLVAAGPGEPIGGLPAQLWLEHVGRVLPGEARRILAVADVLPDLPAVRAAWARGRMTFAQVRSVATAAGRMRGADRAELDVRVATAASQLRGATPGELLDVADRVVDELQQRRLRDRERRVQRGQFLAISPFLTGDGGSIYGEYGAAGLAAIADGVDAAAPRPELDADPGGDPQVRAANRRAIGAARAQGLLRLIAAAGAPQGAVSSAGDGAAGPDGGITVVHADADGREAAADGIAAGDAAADRDDDEGDVDETWGRLARRPLVLATVDLGTLLGLAERPGRLLTTLTGGTLRCSAHAARQLAATPQGADLRLVVHDQHGATVGVGRTAYQPPTWLREATLTVHPRCAFPSCRRPARQAQLDHVRSWGRRGRTEAGNLGPLCASHHRWKTSGRWRLAMQPDGTCVWTHPTTGTTVEQPSLIRLDRLAAGRSTAAAGLDRDPAGAERRRSR